MPTPTRTVKAFLDVPRPGGAFAVETVRGRIQGGFGIAGDVGTDVVSKVLQVQITRGRSRQFDEISTGTAVVTLNNRDRRFDSLNTAGPYYGKLRPRLKWQLQLEGEDIFVGSTESIRYTHVRNEPATAIFKLTDRLGTLADRSLDAFTPPVQLPGQRIIDTLIRPEVQVESPFDIDAGQFTLGAYPVDAGTKALAYFKLVARSDYGRFFASRHDVLTFRDRRSGSTSPVLLFRNVGANGIRFVDVARESGVDLTFNRVTASRVGGSTEVFENLDSIGEIGAIDYDLTNLLVETDDQAYAYGEFIASTYADPEDRFASIELELHGLTRAQRIQVAQLDIASMVQVDFLVGGIGVPIQRLAVVEGINQTIRQNSHRVQIFLGDPVNRGVFTIEDPVFGFLDGLGRLGF